MQSNGPISVRIHPSNAGGFVLVFGCHSQLVAFSLVVTEKFTVAESLFTGTIPTEIGTLSQLGKYNSWIVLR